jgi:hypothetical protein
MTWSLMQRPLTKALPSAKVKHYANGLGLCTKRGGDIAAPHASGSAVPDSLTVRSAPAH